MGSKGGVPPSLRPWQSSRTPETGASQSRRDRHDESWVEISSQPSSSSLSSIGDEVITTGLRVGSRQRRLAHNQRRPANNNQRPANPAAASAVGAAASSSQDEYEETESEDDHFLTSSGEKLSMPSTPSRRITHPETDSDDCDENATALGMGTRRRRKAAAVVPDSPPPFRPQPNVFSHPPSQFQPDNHPHSAVRGGPGGVRNLPRLRAGGPSFMGGAGAAVGGPSSTAPAAGYQPDNDAALRASLTTLLSCAAAARGIPKDGNGNGKEKESLPTRRPGGGVSPGDQPVELRLVQEAELMGEASPSPAAGAAPPAATRRSSDGRSGSGKADEKTSRRRAAAAGGAGGRSSPRATKKRRSGSAVSAATTATSAFAADESIINPTLLTWVVSAGVVVLVSVVGFGAGYVIGREVGKQEGVSSLSNMNLSSSLGDSATGCGREVIRSGSGAAGGTLRRIRWGTEVARSVVAS